MPREERQNERRVVLDTNAVVSGLLFPGSVPANALLKAQKGIVLSSDGTRLELIHVMSRSRFDRYVEREIRQRLTAQYLNATELIDVAAPIHACRDPRDDKFLEVLVLYLERPATRVRSRMVLAGRFGYSDLKEAAHMEAYVF